jgi:hypothetical protein
VLQPNSFASQVVVARNAPVREILFNVQANFGEEVKRPSGCVHDLGDAKEEYRRATFLDPDSDEGHWRIKTEIVHPKVAGPEGKQPTDPSAKVGPITFKDYEQKDGLVDWTKTHVASSLIMMTLTKEIRRRRIDDTRRSS